MMDGRESVLCSTYESGRVRLRPTPGRRAVVARLGLSLENPEAPQLFFALRGFIPAVEAIGKMRGDRANLSPCVHFLVT